MVGGGYSGITVLTVLESVGSPVRAGGAGPVEVVRLGRPVKLEVEDVDRLLVWLVGAVDGLLGSIIQGGTRLNFIIDNLGNIVQEIVTEAGDILSSIVGNYKNNMTYTGQSKDLGNGLTEKTYNYSPLGALVNIIVNGLNQVVQATVVKGGSTNTQTATTAQPQPTQSAPPVAPPAPPAPPASG